MDRCYVVYVIGSNQLNLHVCNAVIDPELCAFLCRVSIGFLVRGGRCVGT